jgi:hypothetical protein
MVGNEEEAGLKKINLKSSHRQQCEVQTYLVLNGGGGGGGESTGGDSWVL